MTITQSGFNTSKGTSSTGIKAVPSQANASVVQIHSSQYREVYSAPMLSHTSTSRHDSPYLEQVRLVFTWKYFMASSARIPYLYPVFPPTCGKRSREPMWGEVEGKSISYSKVVVHQYTRLSLLHWRVLAPGVSEAGEHDKDVRCLPKMTEGIGAWPKRRNIKRTNLPGCDNKLGTTSRNYSSIFWSIPSAVPFWMYPASSIAFRAPFTQFWQFHVLSVLFTIKTLLFLFSRVQFVLAH